MSCPCYRGEAVAWKNAPVFQEVIADPQAWVTHVTQHKLFQKLRREARQPEAFVSVSTAKGNTSLAHTAAQHIELGGPATQGLLLHELAHLCTPDHSDHDFAFCGNYLKLTRYWLGEFAAEELLRQLRAAGAFP